MDSAWYHRATVVLFTIQYFAWNSSRREPLDVVAAVVADDDDDGDGDDEEEDPYGAKAALLSTASPPLSFW